MQLIVIRRQPRHRNVARVKSVAGRARDRRVRKEARRAKIFAYWATKRARRIGPVNAVTDRQVVRLVQESAKHTARAAEYTLRPPKSHRLRNGLIASAGTAAVVAAVYGWRSRPDEAPLEDAATEAEEPATAAA